MDRIIAIKEKVFRMKQNTLHKSVAIRAQQLMARKKKQLSVFTLLILDRIIARNNTDKIIAERFFGKSKLTLYIFLSAADTAKFLWKKRIDFPFLSFYTDNIIARGNKGFMDEAGKHRLKAESDKITACIFSRRISVPTPVADFILVSNTQKGFTVATINAYQVEDNIREKGE